MANNVKNRRSFNDIKSIRQKFQKLSLYDLHQVLNITPHKFRVKTLLRKYILNWLRTSPSKSKELKRRIVEVYYCRLRKIRRSQHDSSSETSHPFPVLQNPITEFEPLSFFKIMQTLYISTIFKIDADKENFSGFFPLNDDVKRLIDKSWNISKHEHTIQIIVRLEQIGLEKNVKKCLPNNLVVSVDNHQCKLPSVNIPMHEGDTPWRYNVPIDITQEANLENGLHKKLQISWLKDQHQYILGVFVAQKLTSEDLLVQLKSRPLRPSNKTIELIKKENDSDDLSVVDSLVMTLIDPLSRTRMHLPIRGIYCLHINCFDAIQFLRMNALKPTWICPICKQKAKFENIEVDEYSLNILQSPNLSEECDFVRCLADGSWTEIMDKKNKNTTDRNIIEILIDSNDEEDVVE